MAFSKLTSAGLAELPALFPEAEAVFMKSIMAPELQVSNGGSTVTDISSPDEEESGGALPIEQLRTQPPWNASLKIVHLSAEISADAYDQLVAQYEEKTRLDLSSEAYYELTEAGLAELPALFPAAVELFMPVGGGWQELQSIDAVTKQGAEVTIKHADFSTRDSGRYLSSLGQTNKRDSGSTFLTLQDTPTDGMWEVIPTDDHHTFKFKKIGQHDSGWFLQSHGEHARHSSVSSYAMVHQMNNREDIHWELAESRGCFTFKHPAYSRYDRGNQLTVVDPHVNTCGSVKTHGSYAIIHRSPDETDAHWQILVAATGPAIGSEAVNLLRQQLPSLKVVHLGAEISADAYDQLVQQYDEKKWLDLSGEEFSGLTEAGLGELAALFPLTEAVFSSVVQQQRGAKKHESGLPTKFTLKANNGQYVCAEEKASEETRPEQLKKLMPSLKVAQLGTEISSEAFDKMAAEYAATKRLDLTGEEYSGLAEKGLAELPAIFPELQMPTAKIAQMGRELSPLAYDAVIAHCEKTDWLDLTGSEFAGVADAGLIEILRACPNAEAMFTGVTESGPTFKEQTVESSHNYKSNENSKNRVELLDKPAQYCIKFDSQCKVENKHDHLTITCGATGFSKKIANGSEDGAWRDIEVEAHGELTFHLRSDGDTEFWGYRATVYLVDSRAEARIIDAAVFDQIKQEFPVLKCAHLGQAISPDAFAKLIEAYAASAGVTAEENPETDPEEEVGTNLNVGGELDDDGAKGQGHLSDEPNSATSSEQGAASDEEEPEEVLLQMEDGQMPSASRILDHIFSLFADGGRMDFAGIKTFFEALQAAFPEDRAGELSAEDWEAMCGEFGIDSTMGMDVAQFERLLEPSPYAAHDKLWELYTRIVALRQGAVPLPHSLFGGITAPELQVSDDGSTVTDISQRPNDPDDGLGRYRVAVAKAGVSATGRHTWKIEVMQASRTLIGVVTGKVQANWREKNGRSLHQTSESWVVCPDGKPNMNKWHSGKSSATGLPALSAGNVLEICLDCDAHTVTFSVDGVGSDGSATMELPADTEFFVAASFGGDAARGGSVKLISDQALYTSRSSIVHVVEEKAPPPAKVYVTPGIKLHSVSQAAGILDLRSEEFAELTAECLAEVPALFPRVEAVFMTCSPPPHSLFGGITAPELQVSDDGSTVTDISQRPNDPDDGLGRYRVAVAKAGVSATGRHTWKIEVMQASRTLIGVVTGKVQANWREKNGRSLHQTSESWVVCPDGKPNMNKWHSGKSSATGLPALSAGNVLEICLDCDAHTVTFSVDGVGSDGSATMELPADTEFFVAASFGGDAARGGSVKLISDQVSLTEWQDAALHDLKHELPSSLICAHLGTEISPEAYAILRKTGERVDFQAVPSEDVEKLTAAGIRELPRVCPNAKQLFSTGWVDQSSATEAVQIFKEQCHLIVAHLGCQISAEAFDRLMDQYSNETCDAAAKASGVLDLSDEPYSSLKADGITELLELCPTVRVLLLAHTVTLSESEIIGLKTERHLKCVLNGMGKPAFVRLAQSYDDKKRLTMEKSEYDRLHGGWLLELACVFPDVREVFTVALDQSRSAAPSEFFIAMRTICKQLQCAILGSQLKEAMFDDVINVQYNQDLGGRTGKMLRLVGNEYATLNDEGLAELVQYCPDANAIFVDHSDLGGLVTQDALIRLRFQSQSAALVCAALGRQIKPEMYTDLHAQYARDKTLNVCQGTRVPPISWSSANTNQLHVCSQVRTPGYRGDERTSSER